MVLLSAPSFEAERPAARLGDDRPLKLGGRPAPREGTAVRAVSALEGLKRRHFPDSEPQQEGVALGVTPHLVEHLFGLFRVIRDERRVERLVFEQPEHDCR